MKGWRVPLKRAALAVALACGAAACRITPYCRHPGATPRLFELSYPLDYHVPNYVKFDWSDDFLLGDPDEYRQELAGPLAALAASTYGAPEEMDLRSLERLGFPRARTFRRYGRAIDYSDPKWKKDQVGFTLAAKDAVFGDGTKAQVVVVAVRGTFGRDEWVSNLNVCNSWGRDAEPFDLAMPSHHQGFERAAANLLEAFESFAAAEAVDFRTAKILVCGHSRGGAVANLVGARLCEDARIPHGNLFVYTFAAPNTIIRAEPAGTDRRYWNVFNVLNPEDCVPLVPLVAWNSHRYGRDLHLKHFECAEMPRALVDAAYLRMKDEFEKMTGVSYWHMLFGTWSTDLLPSAIEAVAPDVPALYHVPPDQRADGNLTSVQSILESLIYRGMRTAEENEKISLGDDIARLSQIYSKMDAGLLKSLTGNFIIPDGRTPVKPGFWDIPWRIVCSHATQTYVGWMKAGEFYGPRAIYSNWDDASAAR
ncbi:MAG: hypothetical protein MJ138_06200 [Kiritimatiellae bacterium]|nr:hypothetical protein [Kiritimatiellia bacterium]